MRYFVRKRVDSAQRLATHLAAGGGLGLAANYYGAARAAAEPFAALHRVV